VYAHHVAALLLISLPSGLVSQQPRPGAPGLDIAAARKAVVTIHALDASGRAIASGTGFFVTEGYVLTAAHVLVGASGCSVELADGQKLRCSVAASDTGKDVVMLMVPGTPPATLRWGSSETARDGDEVTVISNPLGDLPGTISKGIVSASRVVDGTKLLQISAAISHGSSGAPVLNARGQVIGIVRSTIERGQALNFATATDAVRNLNNDPTAVAEAQSVLAPKGADATAGNAPSGRSGSVVSAQFPQISVGQTVTGTLTSADSLFVDTTYYKIYQFTAPAGRPITINLSSDDFDPMLIIRGGALPASIINDDGGPGCASRVSQAFPGRGPYRILVNTTVTPRRQTGRFTLSLTDGSQPVQPQDTHDCQVTAAAAAPSAAHTITVGQTQQGSLTADDVVMRRDSTYVQAWTIQGRAGQTVTIDVESDDFDAYVFLRGPGIPEDQALQDDDSGGNCNARLTASFPQAGEYEIVVNSAGAKYATGTFALSVTSGSKPKSVARCSRSQ
jgi:serine protease Do